MLKIFTALIIGLTFLGCGPIKSAITPSGMFQTVSEKEAVLVQDNDDKKYCVRCSMDLVKFYKTSHSATHDGKDQQYCSIHCLQDHINEGAAINNAKVVDIESLKFIEVSKAHYVVGSSKRGTMSRVSKYAFANLDDAKNFQEKFGGDIMNFDQAIEKAKEDFR